MIIALSGCMFFDSPSNDDTTLSVEGIYEMAKSEGYSGTLEDFVNEFKGESGLDGKDGVGIKSAKIVSGSLVITYTDNSQENLGPIMSDADYEKITPTIGENGNWFVGGEDTGVDASPESAAASSSVWHSGADAPDAAVGSDGDFYIMTSNSSVYNKKDGTWVYVGTMEDKTQSTGGSGMSVAAINRSLLSSVSIVCDESNAGSGVIYKLDKSKGEAYVITNYHVVYNSSTLRVYNDSTIKIYLYGMELTGYAIDCTYVGGSAGYDIAVLKVTGSEILKDSDAVAAIFSDSDKVRPLDSVVAIGNSLGYGIATTAGHVNKESEEILTYVANQTHTLRVMRIDAPVNEGNSGGGAYNINGEIIGIVNAKKESAKIDNVGYAIPANLAKAVAENIIYFCDGTSATAPKKINPGINMRISSSKTAFDPDTGMVTVREEITVDTVGSFAAAAGVEFDDVLKSVTVGGVEYEITRLYQLPEALLNARPNSTVTLVVLRNGNETTVTLTMPSSSSYSNIY